MSVSQSREGLVRQFQKAGLKVELADKPMVGSITADGRNAFQLDISRPKTKEGPREVFRVWAGHDENLLQILGVNSDLQQAVLMVKEPKRELEIPIPGWQVKRFQALNPTVKVFERNGQFFHKQTTPDTKRHYLLGMDERHYFACQLPKPATTVSDAHRVLKSDTVKETERKAKVARQGEWFFIKPTPEQKEDLEAALKANRAVVHRKVGIGNHMGFTLGRPHTADQLAVVAVRSAGTEKVETRRAMDPDKVLRVEERHRMVRTVFIRGKVKHVEHKTVEFADWMLVARNTELRGQGRMDRFGNGINWID